METESEKELPDKVILDTSIIISGKASEMLQDGEISDSGVIVPGAVLDELQAQASKNREQGFIGLNELKKIRSICEEKSLKMEILGEKPSLDDIRLAKGGRIDAMIRDVAKMVNGILLTSDYVQALVGEAEGVRTRLVRTESKTQDLAIEGHFTQDTLSVHLKEGVKPMAKRGKPGGFQLVTLSENPLSKDDLENTIREVTEAARTSGKGSFEITLNGATVLQLGSFRIAITRPPFSDGIELTAVRPIVKLSLEDYQPSDKLLKRLGKVAEGILIAGSPGSGKSTLASALAEFYSKQGKIVKTFESPKDLQVGPEVTQYGPLEGDFERTAEILLLVRPDYTIFDEVRKAKDFQTFSDMRLAGVGMVGVVHASDPIDAVQRFMGKVDLGIIPHIVDTVIFVEKGRLSKTLELDLTVKVPSGMTEADLTRPIVEVKDFESGKLEYEIYAYGQENVIVPVAKVGKSLDAIEELASQRIHQVVRKFDPDAQVDIVSRDKVVVRVDKRVIPRFIGRGGIMISEIEESLGVRIDVEPRLLSVGEELSFELVETGNSLDLVFDTAMVGRAINVYIESEYLASGTIGRKAKFKISKTADAGKKLADAVRRGQEIKTLAKG